MVGKITSCQGGHNITNQGLRKLLSKNENFSIIELKEKNIPAFLFEQEYSKIYRLRFIFKIIFNIYYLLIF